MDINLIAYYGDILALPFFLALTVYFLKIQNRTSTESTLLILNILALMIDSVLVTDVKLSKTYTIITDMLAIPFLSLMVYYFYNKTKNTNYTTEILFLLFSFLTLCIDLYFTFNKINSKLLQ